VRLPSAIAGLLTCMAIIVLAVKYLKDYWFGIIAVLVLISSQGYVNGHVTRTGDYDALLTLFTTVAGLSFFAYCENQRSRWLYYFFAFTILAALTKGITALLFSPALLIYVVWRRQLITLLKNKNFYIGIASFLTIVVGYYFLREAYNPGYIEAVFENELGGRFLNTLEAHEASAWFYYDNLMNSLFKPWFYLIPCGILVGFFIKDERIKRIAIFCTLMATVFLLVISISQTKLEWYDAPLYPFLSIIVAIFVYAVYGLLKGNEKLNAVFAFNPLPVLFLFLLVVAPYRAMLQKTYLPQEYPWDKDFYEMSYYLRDGLRGKHDLNSQTLCYDGYSTHLAFYINLMNDKGINVHLKDWTKVEAGDIVFTYQDNIKDYLTQNFKLDTLNQFYRVTTYQLHERIQPIE
jgi:4-amino-4-deoxy-L-arabinose transferase-like glycosyltransferase